MLCVVEDVSGDLEPLAGEVPGERDARLLLRGELRSGHRQQRVIGLCAARDVSPAVTGERRRMHTGGGAIELNSQVARPPFPFPLTHTHLFSTT
eukprot:scaffold33455_cov46-Phaeocystis_antarctica.AAC.1